MNEDRFEFGKNWKNYAKDVEDEHIRIAEQSLIEALSPEQFKGKTFLDIGSGSGLFSLVATRLGATVFSFDYDIDSVECTQAIKDRFAPNSDWSIEQGSILDEEYLSKIEKADIVYSWGVLHSTGNMYKAFHNISTLVKPQGHLFISIYNNQGSKVTRYWLGIKKEYVNGNEDVRSKLLKKALHELWGRTFTDDFFDTGDPLKSWNEYKKYRGMSAYHDLVDWVGGLPYEVATRKEVTTYFRKKNFELVWQKPNNGTGCNEYLFRKVDK